MNLQPPVGRFSPADEITDWIGELERLAADPALRDEENQAQLQAHLERRPDVARLGPPPEGRGRGA